MEILDQHIIQLEQQIVELKSIKAIAAEKKALYAKMLQQATETS
ncbi:hypothetical protein [Bacillus sp. M6-12]|nr:hypothetical protein [Bacillus sp. M6-12]